MDFEQHVTLAEKRLRSDSDKAAELLLQDAKLLIVIRDRCRQVNHPGVNTGAHKLANDILKLIDAGVSS